MKRVIVTGASGLLGRSLVSPLFHMGYDLVSIDRHRPSSQKIKSKYIGDIARSNIVDDVTEKADAIVHLAANVHGCHGEDCFVDNVYGSMRIMDLAERINCKKIVLASTSGVYETIDDDVLANESHRIAPKGDYATTKMLSECLFMNSSLSPIILRFTYLYSTDLNKGWIGKALQSSRTGEVIRTRQERRDYLHILDAVQAIIKAIEYQGKHKVFNIGTGNSVPMKEVAELIARVGGQDATVQVIGERHNVRLDSTLAKCELGWTPSRFLLDDIESLSQGAT